MNEERKYKKVINRNGWMCRLFKFSTGREPQFQGFCPFFWSTIFWIVLFPITVICRLLEVIMSFLALAFKKEQKAHSVRQNLCFIKIAENNYSSYTLRSILNGEYCSEDFDSIPNWKEKIQAILDKREKQAEIDKANYERKKARQEKYEQFKEKLTFYGKFLIWPGLIASSIGAAFLVWKFVAYCASLITVQNLIDVGAFFLIVGLIALTILSLFKLVKKCVDWKERVESVAPLEPAEDKGPGIISRFFEGIGELWDGAKIVYRRECPLIEWSDDKTKPIEKIQSEKE